jgi:hypothetical protein
MNSERLGNLSRTKRLSTKTFTQDKLPMLRELVQDGKHLSTKPFMQGNFPTIMQFIQDKAFEHKAIYLKRPSDAQGIRPGRSI